MIHASLSFPSSAPEEYAPAPRPLQQPEMALKLHEFEPTYLITEIPNRARRGKPPRDMSQITRDSRDVSVLDLSLCSLFPGCVALFCNFEARVAKGFSGVNKGSTKSAPAW